MSDPQQNLAMIFKAVVGNTGETRKSEGDFKMFPTKKIRPPSEATPPKRVYHVVASSITVSNHLISYSHVRKHLKIVQ